MIVAKAVNMAKLMNVPILGVVENMSWLKCPHCGEAIDIFGKSHTAEAAARQGLSLLDSIPLDPNLAILSDEGHIEQADTSYLNNTIQTILKL